METSTILLTGTAVLSTLAAAGIGFLAGRASTPGDHAPVIAERTEAAAAAFPKHVFPAPDGTAAADLRTQLLHALERPAPERNRSIRVAMNAWLAADGAAAIMAARNDPELGQVADRMRQFALFAYPELFVDDSLLLKEFPDAGESITMAARAMAMFDPDSARGLIDTRLSDSMFGDAVLKAADQIERAGNDPYAELESIVADGDWPNQVERLIELVIRVAADDPAAAAELIDDMPSRMMGPATQVLVQVWSRTDPEETARWLAQKQAQVSENELSRLAQVWGQSDFEAATAFADTLTGGRRVVFLAGLVSATHRLSKEEQLVWMSRYEDDPSYPSLVMRVAQRLAAQDPEAAVALIDEIGNESVRGRLVLAVAGTWAQNDAESALEWARGLARGRTRDQAIASVAPLLMDMELGLDRAIDVINEIEDPEVRKGPAWWLLRAVESDDEALRLGRDYGFDRDAVLELRKDRSRMHRPGLVGTVSRTFGIEGRADADEE